MFGALIKVFSFNLLINAERKFLFLFLRQAKHGVQMTGAVKDASDDFRRSVVGPPGPRGGRYFLRPDYAHAHAHPLVPPSHHHHHEVQRHDFPPREFFPQEKVEDLYARHKEDFFTGRPKDREDLPPPGGYGCPPTPDDPYARVPPSARGPRIADRFPRLQDYPPPPPTPESRGGLYGAGVPASAGAPVGPGVVGSAPAPGSAPMGAGPGGERVSRLLELYGTLDARTPASRSHHDLYGSLDGRASRLSDIFPTSESRLRPADIRSDETRSLSGREGALADLYRRRELPPAPPEYRLHDYRPRHDFRGPQKPPQQVQSQPQPQQPHDQDVIENPMYDVERRSGPPRTPGPRVATPTTTPNGPPHHAHLAHMAHHSNSPTPAHHGHPSLHPGLTTPGHSVGHTPTHPSAHAMAPPTVGMGGTHSVGPTPSHPSAHTPGHPSGHGIPSVGHSTPAERGELRYTAAIAQQEEALR